MQRTIFKYCILETAVIIKNNPFDLPIWIPLPFYKPYPHWQLQQSLTPKQRQQQLMLAAMTAISDYQAESDLLAFSDLDGEDFIQDSDENIEVAHTDA